MPNADPAMGIATANQRRHNHHGGAQTPTCKRCGAYVTKGDPDGNRLLRYPCHRCGYVLERV